jgi:hypothetical protein
MTSNQETLAGVAQCTSTGHGDAEAPQTLPMRTLFAASVGNAVEWYDWTVDATFSILPKSSRRKTSRWRSSARLPPTLSPSPNYPRYTQPVLKGLPCF